MNTYYDAGALIAADRNDRRMWAEHRARLEAGIAPIATAPVVAQASRSSRQVQLRRLLRGCEVVPFAPADAHRTGEILAAAGTSDVVDAHLVIIAAGRPGHAPSTVITSDIGDLRRLAHEVEAPPALRQI
jgi:hypothetical protein